MHSECRAELSSLVMDNSDTEAPTADDGLLDGILESVDTHEWCRFGNAWVTY